jgi:hypothetical protein
VELTPPDVKLAGVGPLKKTKMRYGPYAVPSMNTKSVMGEAGALWNCGVGNITKPADEFVILGLKAGLEYPVSFFYLPVLSFVLVFGGGGEILFWIRASR